MSYLVQAKLAEDAIFMKRITACAATQGIADPTSWAYRHQWALSAQPGWVDAYKYALDSGDESPGANEGAITDGMILSAVQHLTTPPNEPDPEPEPDEGNSLPAPPEAEEEE